MDINEVYALIMGNNYYHAAAVFILYFIGARVAVWLIEKIFMGFAKKTETILDDMILEAINKYIYPLVILTGLMISLQILHLGTKTEAIILNILLSLIIIFLGLILYGISKAIVDNWGAEWAKKTNSQVDEQAVKLFRRFFRIVFFILIFLFILIAWNVKVGALLASLGVAGIAVAFALQNTLGNIFGGVSLIIDKSIKAGDIVEIDKDTGGKIVDVGIRSTKIKSWNNELIIIPNGVLANSKIVNQLQPDPSIRIVIPFSVAYGSDAENVKRIVTGELKKIEGFLKEPEPHVRFLELGSSSINFKAYFYIKDVDNSLSAKDEAHTRIYNILKAHNVEMPFPQMDIHIVDKK